MIHESSMHLPWILDRPSMDQIWISNVRVVMAHMFSQSSRGCFSTSPFDLVWVVLRGSSAVLFAGRRLRSVPMVPAWNGCCHYLVFSDF